MRHVLLITLAALIMVTIGCKGRSVITPEQAMDAVRTFEGDSTLQLRCDPLYEGLESPQWKHKRTYDIDDTQNDEHSWTVDAASGDVIWAMYREARPEQSPQDPTGPLTQAECRQIAVNFARAKYADFDTMGFQLDEPTWDGDGWSFFWGRKNAYGAWIPDCVSIDISPADGRVQCYYCSRLSVQMPTPEQPQITSGEAISIAKTAAGISTFWKDPEPGLTQDPDNTYWGFEIIGVTTQGQRVSGGVTVDAVSGEILSVEIDDDMGPSAQPMQACTVVPNCISIRDLAEKVPGARVHWLGKDGARLFVGKNRYTLVPGKDTIEWTGGTIKLSARIKLVDGRLVVPSDLVDVLNSTPAPKKAPTTPTKSK